MYKPIDADVIIIGGGIAGLTAAYWLFLKEPTLDVVILEGSERIGGRAFSIPLLVERGEKVSNFDLGAQWVCREQNQLLNLLDSLGVTYQETQKQGKIITYYQGNYICEKKVRGYPFFNTADKFQLTMYIIKVEALCRTIKHDRHTKYVKQLNEKNLKQFIYETVSSDAVRAVLNHMVLAHCGFHPRQISALFYIFFCISTRGICHQLPLEDRTLLELKIDGGVQSLCDTLADKIGRDSIFMDEHVQSVAACPRYVEVVSRHATYRYMSKAQLTVESHTLPTVLDGTELSTSCFNPTFCLAPPTFPCPPIKQLERSMPPIRLVESSVTPTYTVIVAVPPKDILNMKFSPSLDENHLRAIHNTCTSTVTNFVATFETEFWKSSNLSGECFFFDKAHVQGPIDYCTCISTSGNAVLTGRLFHRNIPNNKFPVYRQEVLGQLAHYFGDEALHPLDYCERSWTNHSCQMVGWEVGNNSYMKHISHSYDRVFFAGAETSYEWYGYLAGAVHSGVKAALQTLSLLRPASLGSQDVDIISPGRRRAQRIPLRTYYTESMYSVMEHWKLYISVTIVALVVLWRVKKRYFDT